MSSDPQPVADGKRFTYTEKLEAVKRELKYRERVYPVWINKGRITQVEAAWQIAVMKAIRDDYELFARRERLL